MANNERPVPEDALTAADAAAAGSDDERSNWGKIERAILDGPDVAEPFSDDALSTCSCHEKKPDAVDGSGKVVGIFCAGLTEFPSCEEDASRMASWGMSTYSNVAIAGQVYGYHV